MKNFAIFFTISWFLWPGEMKEWPTHTICKTKDFEAYYKSCGQDINLLYSNTRIFINGVNLFHQEKSLCEKTAPKYSFCGKRKGEYVFYNHSVKFGIPELHKGQYYILLELLNEHNYKVACANFTLYSHPQA
ncbi:lymphocyte antigen 86 isoform X2 [Ranitomeya variabilis]|uniref:lymphocyte antigen 86 isoform X2 n=1 Tax=Ranitomeya variabilis TaxID=490064 RepID=UPI0040572F93